MKFETKDIRYVVTSLGLSTALLFSGCAPSNPPESKPITSTISATQEPDQEIFIPTDLPKARISENKEEVRARNILKLQSIIDESGLFETNITNLSKIKDNKAVLKEIYTLFVQMGLNIEFKFEPNSAGQTIIMKSAESGGNFIVKVYVGRMQNGAFKLDTDGSFGIMIKNSPNSVVTF